MVPQQPAAAIVPCDWTKCTASPTAECQGHCLEHCSEWISNVIDTLDSVKLASEPLAGGQQMQAPGLQPLFDVYLTDLDKTVTHPTELDKRRGVLFGWAGPGGPAAYLSVRARDGTESEFRSLGKGVWEIQQPTGLTQLTSLDTARKMACAAVAGSPANPTVSASLVVPLTIISGSNLDKLVLRPGQHLKLEGPQFNLFLSPDAWTVLRAQPIDASRRVLEVLIQSDSLRNA